MAAQAFAGSLMGNKAGKGVMITISQFSKDAKDYVKTVQQPKIVLIDGEQLAQFMIDHDFEGDANIWVCTHAQTHGNQDPFHPRRNLRDAEGRKKRG
ncbi:MAG: restriction endonuclease [Methanothrix sp.]|nr:restriction endonuclease [Methanothrix sp.]MDD5767594.1 restriction endonuclease [Methanothrix sp.]